MILETTNPKHQTRAQIPGGRKFVFRTEDRGELEFVSAGSRSMAKGEAPEPNFRDRLPHEAPKPNREPEPRRQCSMWLADESPDAPQWMIRDVVTGHVMARVRGSLPWGRKLPMGKPTMMNTFEHGYSDVVQGRQCVLGAPAYKAGYEHGSCYRRNQKAIELTVLGILAVTIGVVFALLVADAAGGLSV